MLSCASTNMSNRRLRWVTGIKHCFTELLHITFSVFALCQDYQWTRPSQQVAGSVHQVHRWCGKIFLRACRTKNGIKGYLVHRSTIVCKAPEIHLHWYMLDTCVWCSLLASIVHGALHYWGRGLTVSISGVAVTIAMPLLQLAAKVLALT